MPGGHSSNHHKRLRNTLIPVVPEAGLGWGQLCSYGGFDQAFLHCVAVAVQLISAVCRSEQGVFPAACELFRI